MIAILTRTLCGHATTRQPGAPNSICLGWMLLCEEFIMAEGSPHITIRTLTTILPRFQMIAVILREGKRQRERETETETETERQRQTENSNSNSKTLFSKDCSLGSFRPV